MAQHNDFEDSDQIYCQLRGASELPFSDVLEPERVARVLAALGGGFRQRIYTPLITLWMFLGQVLSPDHSCQDAVARLLAWRVSRGRRPISTDTSSYCEARQRLPLELFQRLTTDVAAELEGKAAKQWLWKERHVKIVDGSTATMPDTPANQLAFPQNGEQQPGLGFPLARIVVIFSLATGAALAAVISAARGKRTGETSLFRGIFDVLQPGDVLLADRLFAGFRDLARCAAARVDIVARQHSGRRTDFRRGQWVGHLDHLVTLSRPCFNRERYLREEWDCLPGELRVRELRYRVAERGFRTIDVTLVTTLLDPLLYPAEDLAALYRERWACELDLRSLKCSLQMGHLRCKTPEMVEKEIWTHLLAYNLIRATAAAAARRHGVVPRHVSFKGTVQMVNAFASQLPRCPTRQDRAAQWNELLAAIVHIRVGHRPDRFEPRKLKQRHSKYPYLTRTRNEERRRLCA